MGLMRWMRGGDDADSSAGMLSAGLAELGGFFSPGQRKQTEHVEEMKRLRKEVHSSDSPSKIDLDRGIAVIRRSKPAAE